MTARPCNGMQPRIVVCEVPYPPTRDDLFEMFSDAAQYVTERMGDAEHIVSVSIDYGDELTCLTLVLA